MLTFALQPCLTAYPYIENMLKVELAKLGQDDSNILLALNQSPMLLSMPLNSM